MLLDGGIQYVPMEVSSHSIEMHRIEDVNFKIAVFTNLTPEHLDFHGTMENYFNSKLKLFKKDLLYHLFHLILLSPLLVLVEVPA